jgi:hypothetical protein
MAKRCKVQAIGPGSIPRHPSLEGKNMCSIPWIIYRSNETSAQKQGEKSKEIINNCQPRPQHRGDIKPKAHIWCSPVDASLSSRG